MTAEHRAAGTRSAQPYLHPYLAIKEAAPVTVALQ